MIDLLSNIPTLALDIENIDWEILYYWKYPHYNHVNRSVWVKLLRFSNGRNFGLLFLQFAQSSMILSPVDFSKTRMIYKYTPNAKYPHHLRWTYNTPEYNNYSFDHYYYGNYVLRKKVQHAYLQKIIEDHFVYKSLQNGHLLLATFGNNSVPKKTVTMHSFKYINVEGYYLLKNKKLTFPEEVHTIHKEVIPMKIAFGDFALNKEIPASTPFCHIYVW